MTVTVTGAARQRGVALAMLIWFVAPMMLLVGGCKKSVEGEEKAWKANVAKVEVCLDDPQA